MNRRKWLVNTLMCNCYNLRTGIGVLCFDKGEYILRFVYCVKLTTLILDSTLLKNRWRHFPRKFSQTDKCIAMSVGNGPCSCVFTTFVRAPGSTVTSVVAKNDSKRDHRKLFDLFRYKLSSFKKLFDTTLVLFKISPYSQKLSTSLVSWYHIVKKKSLPHTTHT